MKRLLVVDDDQCMRDLLQEFLTDEGYEVTVAATTEDAVHALHGRPQDLILTDGLEFRPPYGPAESQGFEALQRAAGDQPIALFTAYGEAAQLNLAERHLAGVWLKPMDLGDLLASIQGVLDPQPAGVLVPA